MAFLQCDFQSTTLGMATSMNVILPEAAAKSAGGEGLPVLYLLHGRSDDHTTWLRRTSIERYVEPLGLAVVMPNGHRGFYVDMAAGFNYETFISEELPTFCQSMFPISNQREKTFIAGLSMGGYGAFRTAFHHPDRYAMAASLSGVMDITDFSGSSFCDETEARSIFGDHAKIVGSGHDLFHLAANLADADRPRLYQCCGTEDFLYEGNVRFRDHLLTLKYDLTYEEGPGVHCWDYWDMMIQRVLAWIDGEIKGDG